MLGKAASTCADVEKITPCSRYSTCTVLGSQYIVPWLAARGPLAYSPAEPPMRDYFFQYSWVVPGIFNPKVNLRRHYYFGHDVKKHAAWLFDFWHNVRKGNGAAAQQYCAPGLASDTGVTAPIAAYHHVKRPYDVAGSLLIQHGSYQWVPPQDQPGIEQGEVLLFRGIGQATVFRCLQFRPEALSPANREIWRRYLGAQAEMLSDSVVSFNTIHDRVNRCETGALRHATRLADEMATRAGLDIRSPGFAMDLWHAAQQGYSLDPVMGIRKFGPHHVVLKTPLNNIRITTFFAHESEVKIIDPSRVSLVEAVGCEVANVFPPE
jgi:hypothetical protein